MPCHRCSLAHCQFRRKPYTRAAREENAHRYTVNTKALARWATERLSLETRSDGAVDARFRYEGTTCSNMGRPLTFQYEVTLGPRREGYPIREQRCGPSPKDTGHIFMCQYLTNAGPLMAAIDREKPLLGEPLDRVLSWQRPANPAGCYCEAAAREHKWGLVLETIHYALHHEGKNGN